MEKLRNGFDSWQEADQEIFGRLEPIYKKYGKKPTYALLKRSKAPLLEEKERFFAGLSKGEECDPDLTPDFDPIELIGCEAEMLELRAKLREYKPANPEEQAIKDAYRWRINSLIADMRIALAAKNGDMRRFNAYNEFIYGKPSAELFSAEVGLILQDAANLANHPLAASAAAQVQEIYGSYDISAERILVDDELFARVKAAREGYFAMALQGVDLPDKVSAEIGMIAVEKILSNIGARTEPYDYKLAETQLSTASVNHTKQEMKYPVNEVYSRPRFIGLWAGHEIGDHVMTTMAGRESEFRLLEIGLDRQEKAGEGRGTINEQIAYESIDEFNALGRARTIMVRHLTIALAKGVDGQPRNFTEVYKMAEPVLRMYALADAEDSAGAVKKAQVQTWDILAGRAMKGAQGRGSAYLKDMIYAEGNYAYWRLAAEKPETIPHWYKGKFDLTNPRHINLLQTLGILPNFDDSQEEEME